MIFRELFPISLSALDGIEAATKTGTLTGSQMAARQEIASLIDTLQLPERRAGLHHIESRHLWFERIARYYAELAAQSRATRG